MNKGKLYFACEMFVRRRREEGREEPTLFAYDIDGVIEDDSPLPEPTSIQLLEKALSRRHTMLRPLAPARLPPQVKRSFLMLKDLGKQITV